MNKLTRIVFEYEDGSKKSLQGVELEKWQRYNQTIAGMAGLTQEAEIKYTEITDKTKPY